MKFFQKYSLILELSTKFYFWNITDSRVGDYEQYQYRYHSKGNLIAISNLSKFFILIQPFSRKLLITIFQSQKIHNYALNNDTSHIIYQNERFFTKNTMVQKSERFAHAIRKYAVFFLNIQKNESLFSLTLKRGQKLQFNAFLKHV